MSFPDKYHELRLKFIKQLKSYLGTPYKQSYHEPESDHYNSDLFLDCCGLVRAAFNDLSDEFGFTLKPYNQCYQYDILPGEIQFDELQAGDLIFYKGSYYDMHRKRMKHNLVHVEVYLGPGERTIAARWQKGVVSVFESYKFESKSYRITDVIFKSIDAWLQGVNVSYCHYHRWDSDCAPIATLASHSFCIHLSRPRHTSKPATAHSDKKPGKAEKLEFSNLEGRRFKVVKYDQFASHSARVHRPYDHPNRLNQSFDSQPVKTDNSVDNIINTRLIQNNNKLVDLYKKNILKTRNLDSKPFNFTQPIKKPESYHNTLKPLTDNTEVLPKRVSRMKEIQDNFKIINNDQDYSSPVHLIKPKLNQLFNEDLNKNSVDDDVKDEVTSKLYMKTESTVDSSHCNSQPIRLIDIDQFSKNKLQEIDDIINTFNFNLPQNIQKDSKYTATHRPTTQQTSSNTNPLIRNMESTARQHRVNDVVKSKSIKIAREYGIQASIKNKNLQKNSKKIPVENQSELIQNQKELTKTYTDIYTNSNNIVNENQSKINVPIIKNNNNNSKNLQNNNNNLNFKTRVQDINSNDKYNDKKLIPNPNTNSKIKPFNLDPNIQAEKKYNSNHETKTRSYSIGKNHDNQIISNNLKDKNIQYDSKLSKRNSSNLLKEISKESLENQTYCKNNNLNGSAFKAKPNTTRNENPRQNIEKLYKQCQELDAKIEENIRDANIYQNNFAGDRKKYIKNPKMSDLRYKLLVKPALNLIESQNIDSKKNLYASPRENKLLDNSNQFINYENQDRYNYDGQYFKYLKLDNFNITDPYKHYLKGVKDLKLNYEHNGKSKEYIEFYL